jgi:hypothetical protein
VIHIQAYGASTLEMQKLQYNQHVIMHMKKKPERVNKLSACSMFQSCQIHMDSSNKKAPHGQYGWYIGPALENYRCYKVYISKTRSERLVKTVAFFPTEVPLPFPSSSELATQAATQLTHALLNLKLDGPFFQVGDKQMLAIQ